jgi:hypothetical protein
VKGLRCGFGVALASSALRRVFVAARRKRVPDAEDTTMFRLTCIELDNGEFAVYINHHLGSEDASGERLSLGRFWSSSPCCRAWNYRPCWNPYRSAMTGAGTTSLIASCRRVLHVVMM